MVQMIAFTGSPQGVFGPWVLLKYKKWDGFLVGQSFTKIIASKISNSACSVTVNWSKSSNTTI